MSFTNDYDTFNGIPTWKMVLLMFSVMFRSPRYFFSVVFQNMRFSVQNPGWFFSEVIDLFKVRPGLCITLLALDLAILVLVVYTIMYIIKFVS
jgi:hypothetical protein